MSIKHSEGSQQLTPPDKSLSQVSFLVSLSAKQALKISLPRVNLYKRNSDF
jgi:hypothetical protein